MVYNHNNILFPAVVAMVALNAMPIMSASCVDGEACELMVRGYNLLEFSPWGAIPIFTTVFVLAILFTCQRKLPNRQSYYYCWQQIAFVM